MALTKEEKKKSALAQLRLGSTPNEVSEQFDIPLSTVYVMSRKLKQEVEEEVVQELVETPIELIKHVVEEAKKSTPTGTSPEAITQIETLVDNVGGLKKLDQNFQSTMNLVLGKFDTFLQSENIELKEVKMISDTVADAYSKVFASGTNIHIGDNNDHSSKQLSVFQNKMGI